MAEECLFHTQRGKTSKNVQARDIPGDNEFPDPTGGLRAIPIDRLNHNTERLSGNGIGIGREAGGIHFELALPTNLWISHYDMQILNINRKGLYECA